MRDFVYVKDVVDVCVFLMHHRKERYLHFWFSQSKNLQCFCKSGYCCAK
ncbi:MAG: hypothetical protein ACK5YS_03005 [bacterium]